MGDDGLPLLLMNRPWTHLSVEFPLTDPIRLLMLEMTLGTSKNPVQCSWNFSFVPSLGSSLVALVSDLLASFSLSCLAFRLSFLLNLFFSCAAEELLLESEI